MKVNQQDNKDRKFAVDRALKFYNGRTVGDPKALAEQFKLLYIDIYNFISNKPYNGQQ